MKKKINKVKIFLTRPIKPDQFIFNKIKNKIFKTGFYTNQSEYVVKLESDLEKYLKCKNLLLVSNGTLALELAIKSLNIENHEIILSPFSWISTATAVYNTNNYPVFVDIDKETMNINEFLIEKKITRKTRAILATHVYGYPCNFYKIKKLAKKYNLKIIYDCSHCFGVEPINKKNNLWHQGDINICSLHSTKLFHTGEGGLIVTKNKKDFKKIKLLRANGINFENKESYFDPKVTNAKLSEMQAAIGLSLLKKVKNEISKRKKVWSKYKKYLNNLKIYFQKDNKKFRKNYQYMMVFLKNNKKLNNVTSILSKNNIDFRKYYDVSLNNLNFKYKKIECKISSDICTRALALPIYSNLKNKQIKKICEIINKYS